MTKNAGVYIVERLLILFPPCLWFSSPLYKIKFSSPLNGVKLYCSNCILPFSTTKSVRSSKIFFFLFFKLLIFFPISKPFDFIPPPTGGGEYSTLYTPVYLLNIVVLLVSKKLQGQYYERSHFFYWCQSIFFSHCSMEKSLFLPRENDL